MFKFFVVLGILNESVIYTKLKQIVPEIHSNSCHEKKKCTDTVKIEPTDLYIAFAYPSIKFTFSFPDIIPGGTFYNFGFQLKKNIPCRLMSEDKERFTRRLVIWTKEMDNHDPAEFEFSESNNGSEYEFALTIRLIIFPFSHLNNITSFQAKLSILKRI